jgi:integrase
MPALTAKNLTDAFCRSAKAASGNQVSYPDALVRGLELRVSPRGAKTWSFRYRAADGMQRRLTLGSYSADPQGRRARPSDAADAVGTENEGADEAAVCFDLEAARRDARAVRVALDKGQDPVEERRLKRLEARSRKIRTFDDLSETYFQACERGEWRPKNKHKRASTLTNEREVYARYIKPPLGRIGPNNVTRTTVKGLLRAMVDRGIRSRTNRTHALIRQIFSFAVAEELVKANPVTALPQLVEERPRTRIYDDAELKAMWAGIEHPETLKVQGEAALKRRDGEKVHVGAAIRIALKLAMLLLQRRSEIIGMTLDELDLEHGVWLVPAQRMKTNRPHAVPLSSTAVKLIRQAIALNGQRQTPFVFPSPTKEKPMGGAAMNHALAGVRLALRITDGNVHDFRRTGSTMLTSERIGISPFIRSKVLGHADAGGGAAVSVIHYDANSYMSEKRRALDAWQDLLLEIVGERRRSSNVRRLRRAS